MTTYIFAGPSLPKAERTRWADHFVMLPPITAGDLLAIDTRPGDTVGIIDGYFHQRPSVRHKEILNLLATGINVHGAASMGALRAAELAAFGMIGHGRIFHAYHSGAVVADDEVALLHGTADEDYEPWTLALINIRYCLADAVAHGRLPASAGRAALESASRLPYVERTRERVMEAVHSSGVSQVHCAAIDELIRTAPDVKQADALQLLTALQTTAATPRPGSSHRWQLRETIHLARWRAEATGTSDPELGIVPDHAIHALCQVLATDYPALREKAALHFLAAGTTQFQPSNGSEAELRAAALARLRAMGILAADADTDSGLNGWCTEAESVLPSVERTLKAASRAAVDNQMLTGHFLAHLKAQGRYEQTRDHLRKILLFNRHIQHKRPDLHFSQLRTENIVNWYADRIQSDNINDAALERGFATVDDFVAQARPYYLYEKFYPSLYGQPV